jgi:hypothetical protein
MLGKGDGTHHMDVDAIRSRFIQDNLRRALMEQDRARAARALRAFRNYFQWFESRVPDLEKLTIIGQLARLEEAYARESSEERPLERCQANAR